MFVQVGTFGGEIAFALGAATIDTNKNGKNKNKVTNERRLLLELNSGRFLINQGTSRIRNLWWVNPSISP